MYGMCLALAGRPEFVDEIRNSFNLFSQRLTTEVGKIGDSSEEVLRNGRGRSTVKKTHLGLARRSDEHGVGAAGVFSLRGVEKLQVFGVLLGYWHASHVPPLSMASMEQAFFSSAV